MPAHCGECFTNSRLICTGFHQRGCELGEAMPRSTTLDGKILSLCMIKAEIQRTQRRKSSTWQNNSLALKEVDHEDHSYLTCSPASAAPLRFDDTGG
jgi:hypothetical protein